MQHASSRSELSRIFFNENGTDPMQINGTVKHSGWSANQHHNSRQTFIGSREHHHRVLIPALEPVFRKSAVIHLVRSEMSMHEVRHLRRLTVVHSANPITSELHFTT